jgi:glycine dehydrogenase subunit 2
LIVKEALMVEPTETESKATLDRFIAIVQEIVAEACSDPKVLHDAPHHASVRRVDEATAARHPKLTWS